MKEITLSAIKADISSIGDPTQAMGRTRKKEVAKTISKNMHEKLNLFRMG